MIRIPILKEMAGKLVKDLTLPNQIRISVIYRKGKPLLIDGNTEIRSIDELLLMGKAKAVYRLAAEIESLKEKDEKLKK
jgi:Trk K+ transport system NAD-binding subunit